MFRFGLLFLFFVVNAFATDPPLPYGYLRKVGIPLAKKVKENESQLMAGSKIVGGSQTNLLEHPYLVGVLVHMKRGGEAIATASMMTHTRSLYAAHCWNDGQDFADKLTLVFGSNYVYFGGHRVDTDQVDIHEEWDPITFFHDIAVIKHEHVPTSDVIKPIVLPIEDYRDMDYTGLWATASGYGQREDGVGIGYSVTKQLISNQQCRIFFPLHIIDKHICTNGAGGVAICPGDSGGYLTIRVGENENIQIGIHALTTAPCGSGFPSGYTRVGAYLDWIWDRWDW